MTNKFMKRAEPGPFRQGCADGDDHVFGHTHDPFLESPRTNPGYYLRI